MRIMWRAWGLGALITAGLLLTNGTLPASDAPVVHVKAVVSDGGVRLEAEANGPFEYTTYRPSASLYVLDLSGVTAADPAGARVVASDLVKSYRVLSYTSGEKPVVRVEILLAQGVEPRLERNGNEELALLVSRTEGAVSPASPMPSPAAPAIVPASAKPREAKPAGPALGTIRQIHLAQNGGETEVSITGSGDLAYQALRLQGPDRLVLDFEGSHLTTSEKHIASNLDPVREIRLAQFTPRTSRIVIELREPARYDIKKDGGTVTVAFATKGAKAAPAADPSIETAAIVTPKAKTSIKVAVVARPAGKPGEIPAPPAALPPALAESSSVLAAPAPARPAPPRPQPEMAAPTPMPAVSQAPAAGASSAAKFSGEPISVNLKDVDLRDFFRLIHEISGLNVVVDPSVKGSLTIVLDDVPWDQALDIVLHNNDLDKQLDGNVLRIATKETLRREAEENRDLAKVQAEAASVVTTTRVLSYAKATTMAGTLKKFLSSRGDMIADDRSNTLIIRDIPSTLPVMDNLIRQLDRKSQQVEIEARVVAATRSFSREIGTRFGLATAFSTGGGLSTIGGDTTTGTAPTNLTPAPPLIAGTGGGTATSGQIPLNSNLGSTQPTSAFQYIYQSRNFALDFVIDAAEDRGVGKLLSKPKVITQNNEKATVKQGVKIPVSTIVNNTVSVQFVDAVLELDVTPQITADGTVYMDLTVENDQIDPGIQRVQGIPAIDTQSAETKVTVNDGATVVIGGIIVTTQRTDVQQVPFVGSIPMLGNLFKHTTISSSSQELLFFITPRILPS